MSHPEPYGWLRPKLAALLTEAQGVGIARDVSVAVITDIVNGAGFNTAPLETNEGWNQDIGQPGDLVNTNAPITAEPTFDTGHADHLAPEYLHFKRGF